jgi:CheY-like chemotaxis protein
LFRGFAGKFGRPKVLFGSLPQLAFFGQSLFGSLRITYGKTILLEHVSQLLFGGLRLGAELGDCLALPPQSLHRFIPGEFRMADLGLQVAHHGMGFLQQPFGLFSGGRFGCQSGLGPLQTAGARGDRRWHAAMCKRLMGLIAAQDGHRDIPVLHEAPAMQSATETVIHAARRFRAVAVWPMPLRFAEQSERFAHLRFGCVVWSSVTGCAGIRSVGQSILLCFAGSVIGPQFQILRQFHHLGIKSTTTFSKRRPRRTALDPIGTAILPYYHQPVGTSLQRLCWMAQVSSVGRGSLRRFLADRLLIPRHPPDSPLLCKLTYTLLLTIASDPAQLWLVIRLAALDLLAARAISATFYRGIIFMDRNSASIVAVIDDDNDVGDVLGGLLETMGYQVETYRSGMDFLADAEFEQLACLVVDQNMPKMTGLEMIENLSERGINIPALLITGVHDLEVERKAARLGVMTVLEKPMSHHELLRFISVSMG